MQVMKDLVEVTDKKRYYTNCHLWQQFAVGPVSN